MKLISDSRGATPETVKKAFEILLRDPKVKSIFINIFGGEHHTLFHATGTLN
jgi:succinyl-CoA synthetase beta subunit